MNKRNHYNLDGDILTLEQAAMRVNLGRTATRKYANESGAALKIGRSYRINIQKLIDYLSEITVDPIEDVEPVKKSESKIYRKKSNKVYTTIRIDKDLLEEIKAYAESEDVYISDFMDALLRKGMTVYLSEREEGE